MVNIRIIMKKCIQTGSKKMKKIILIGAGTFSSVLIDLIKENEIYAGYEITGFLDDGKICEKNYNYPLLGKISDAHKFDGENTYFVLSIGNPEHRKRIAENLNGLKFLNLIDKTAHISRDAVLGSGVIILKGASVNTFANIGDFAIVNTGAIIDHHCSVGKYCHIGHGSVLWHNAYIKDAVHILPGTVIKG